MVKIQISETSRYILFTVFSRAALLLINYLRNALKIMKSIYEIKYYDKFC